MATPAGVPDLDALVRDAAAAAAAAADLDGLAQARNAHAGKRSALSAVKKQLGSLAPDDRRAVGQRLNDALAAADAAFATREAELAGAARREQLDAERLDLTEQVGPARRGHLHLVSQTQSRLEDVFVGLGFTVAEGPEIETDWHNFEALNMPPGHPARGMWDTLYVDWGPPGSTLLRTHTSPVQARVMLEQKPPIYVVAPGRVFRRDTADATHMPVFHQIEGLVVDRGITFAHLAGTIRAFTRAYFGGEFNSRLRPSYFPFTEPSAEFDIQRPDGSWLELGGCGMVHPDVLSACGIDPEDYSGFAFGFGIDRLALMRYGVDDLREFFSNDIRFLSQF